MISIVTGRAPATTILSNLHPNCPSGEERTSDARPYDGGLCNPAEKIPRRRFGAGGIFTKNSLYNDVILAEHLLKFRNERLMYHAACADALFLLLAVDDHLLPPGEHGEDELDAL